ncbi:unnamed protein product [Trifolium pratense]|uniref:Uncharacterized protein n=1 Tax=Trifolium pratense TaxID=57577 RepID=A0ACB0JNV9_TRIPR|nr:unnamed protein product [Trifolium pratense]
MAQNEYRATNDRGAKKKGGVLELDTQTALLAQQKLMTSQMEAMMKLLSNPQVQTSSIVHFNAHSSTIVLVYSYGLIYYFHYFKVITGVTNIGLRRGKMRWKAEIKSYDFYVEAKTQFGAQVCQIIAFMFQTNLISAQLYIFRPNCFKARSMYYLNRKKGS